MISNRIWSGALQGAAILTVALGSYVAVETVASLEDGSAASAAAPELRPCADSNGARPGGSVYLAYGTSYRCDVTPPQRLHITRVPSAKVCADMGGHGWTRANPTCWDVDY